MAIIQNKLESGFTRIPNSVINADISAGAFRVYVYMISKPNGWKINNADVCLQLQIKRKETIAKYWKELIDAKLVSRKRGDKTSGFYNQMIYTVLPAKPARVRSTIK